MTSSQIIRVGSKPNDSCPFRFNYPREKTDLQGEGHVTVHRGGDRKDAAASQGTAGAPGSRNILPFGGSMALPKPCLWTGSVQNCKITNPCCSKAPGRWSFATATLGPTERPQLCVKTPTLSHQGFPGGSEGKESTCNAGDAWVGKMPWRRAWQPTPVFLPGDSRGRGA